MATVDDYIALREKVDIFLKGKGEKINSTPENNDDENGCCVCYKSENIFIVKTDCKHNICMSCLTQLKKAQCPMCRKEFPAEITKFLQQPREPQPVQPWFSWSGTPQSVAYYINYR